ncbi:hypothetical protein [Parasitella parasitica]|uniref:Uncharacterized protein n=1 Tax=Parasitella parasitica TaxID=35722 RepID=A0A0B7NDU8_9FUNG|nr:hypothetical protein [Parasitella parasitica]
MRKHVGWNDGTFSTPLMHLGYPICSNIITQLNVAHQKLYDSIRNAIHIHSQRQLFIRGRAAVMNSLIYSTLWHVMRLTTFTISQLLSLRSLGASFINRLILPRLSFDTLVQPRTTGGVGLLDPLAQQQALQWHWVCPILPHYLNSPLLPRYTTVSLLRILFYALSWFYYSSELSHFLYYLLLSSSRRQLWFPNKPLLQFTYLNPFINLQTCVSSFLPSNFDTCYDILLRSLLTNHPSFHSFIPADLVLQSYTSAIQLLVSDVFLFDPESQVIRVRFSFRHVSRHPTVSKSVAMLILSHQLQLKPFFLTQSPPQFSRLSVSSPTIRCGSRILLNSIRHFKQITAPTISPAASLLRPHQWRVLLSTAVPLTARTVWYRAIHAKLPIKSLLHFRIPHDHPSPNCTICLNSTVEDSLHFLFSCPLKLLVWREMFHSFICTTPFSDDILLQLLAELLHYKGIPVNRDPSLPFADLSISQLFACALLTIWQAHWRWIIVRIPFLVTSANHHLTRSLAQLDAELQLHS